MNGGCNLIELQPRMRMFVQEQLHGVDMFMTRRLLNSSPHSVTIQLMDDLADGGDDLLFDLKRFDGSLPRSQKLVLDGLQLCCQGDMTALEDPPCIVLDSRVVLADHLDQQRMLQQEHRGRIAALNWMSDVVGFALVIE